MDKHDYIFYTIGIAILGLLGVFVWLIIATENGNRTAAMVLGGLGLLIAIILAGCFFIAGQALMFYLNARENLAMQQKDIDMLQATGRAALEQQRFLTEMERTRNRMVATDRMLPMPDDDDPWVIESAFDDLDN